MPLIPGLLILTGPELIKSALMRGRRARLLPEVTITCVVGCAGTLAAPICGWLLGTGLTFLLMEVPFLTDQGL